jgi:hypothetical protein
MLLHDSALPGEVVSVVLNNHFPDSIHEDILAATRLDQLQTAKPKRDPKFREQVLRLTVTVARCARSIFVWIILRLLWTRPISVGTRLTALASPQRIGIMCTAP